jgi:hypothetical protein
MKIKTIGILIFCLNISNTVFAQKPPPPPPNCRNFIDDNLFAVIKVFKTSTVPCGNNVPVNRNPVDLGFGSMFVFDGVVNGMSFDTHLSITHKTMGLKNGGTAGTGSFKLMEIVKQTDTAEPGEALPVIVGARITHSKIDGYVLVVDAQDVNNSKSVSIDINDVYEDFDLKISWLNNGCIVHNIACQSKNGQVVVEVDGIDNSYVKTIEYLYFKENVIENKYWQAAAVYWGDLDSQNFNKNVNFVDPGY